MIIEASLFPVYHTYLPVSYFFVGCARKIKVRSSNASGWGQTSSYHYRWEEKWHIRFHVTGNLLVRPYHAITSACIFFNYNSTVIYCLEFPLFQKKKCKLWFKYNTIFNRITWNWTELWDTLQARAGNRDGHVCWLRGIRWTSVQSRYARGWRDTFDKRPRNGQSGS